MSQIDKYSLHSKFLKKEDILFIESVAKKIYDSGLVTPAVFFLEMSKPLTKVNRLEMLDLQKTRTRANQLSRGNTAETKIHKRSFAVSTSRSGIG